MGTLSFRLYGWRKVKPYCLTLVVTNVVAEITVELVSLRGSLCGSINNCTFFSKASLHRVLITSFFSVYVPHLGLIFHFLPTTLLPKVVEKTYSA